MKSQVLLLVEMIRDGSSLLQFNAKKDISTLLRRYEHEGEAFLSMALPRLDDILLDGLENGFLPTFIGWKTKGRVPLFLYGAWVRIFSEDGVLLPNPDVHAIIFIRQLSRTYKKVFEVCDDDRVDAAVKRYVEMDLDIPDKIEVPDSLMNVAHTLFGSTVGRAISEEISPKHGPGAVSERLGANERWDFTHLSPRIQELLGIHYFRPNWYDVLHRPVIDEDIPARLVAVPKTAEKPRLIAIEPSYNQYAQQSLQISLKRILTETSSSASYEDQKRNQDAALRASVDRSFATIDLSDASDLVSLSLVEGMFSWNKSFLFFLKNSRSEWIRLPDGSEHPIGKFASMGSALTFPIEAMVFLSIAVWAMCGAEGDFSRKFIKKMGSEKSGVCVYGDDIIIPTRYTLPVIEALELFGMRVNKKKSFYKGFFRESCGVDAYAGVLVTPVYARRHFFNNRASTEEAVSAVSFRNQLHERGLWPRTVAFLDRSKVLARFPYGDPSWGPTVRHQVGVLPSRTRWNSSLQRTEAKIPSIVPIKRRSKASDMGALLKSFLTGLSYDPTHLDYAGRPIATRIYDRWTARAV